jgi:pyruvate-formate lyase-activating enzyme
MNKLDQLPSLTSQILSGLKADESLKHRILLSAANTETKKSSYKLSFSALVCLCCAVIVFCLVIPQIQSSPDEMKKTEIQVITAGSRRSSSPVHLNSIISEKESKDFPSLPQSENESFSDSKRDP